ncbi:hypothetical protein HAZT_HAZT000258 [Hyalella azteca]|uniref:Protein kinase domain-containing protein n=1 Tax=Hyalella azteca TaxID=294128 RepID=A0A6A0H6M7_HYAAZ|nr:hypothetical protein HAZT_HAZT000258 [Hyalella azteca]
MPPETLERREYSRATDVWSFGVVMWEITNPGEKPFATAVRPLKKDALQEVTRIAASRVQLCRAKAAAAVLLLSRHLFHRLVCLGMNRHEVAFTAAKLLSLLGNEVKIRVVSSKSSLVVNSGQKTLDNSAGECFSGPGPLKVPSFTLVPEESGGGRCAIQSQDLTAEPKERTTWTSDSELHTS